MRPRPYGYLLHKTCEWDTHTRARARTCERDALAGVDTVDCTAASRRQLLSEFDTPTATVAPAQAVRRLLEVTYSHLVSCAVVEAHIAEVVREWPGEHSKREQTASVGSHH